MANVFTFNNTNEYANYVLDKANDFLDKCRIYGDREDRKGLIENIMLSIDAKQHLFEILSKCQGWNGKGQVVLPASFERPISDKEIKKFTDFLLNYQGELLKEAVFDKGEYSGTYNDLDKLRAKYVDYAFYADRIDLLYNEVQIKGKDLNYYVNEASKLSEILSNIRSDPNYSIVRGKCVTSESAKNYRQARAVREIIMDNNHQFINDNNTLEHINDLYGLKLNNGVKTTRAVLKILKLTELYKLIVKDEEGEREFNRAYSRYCDAVNPLTIKKWTVISVNFVDYLTMSYGHKWTSCLNVDKRQMITRGMWGSGCNSRRTLDYALDPSTIVFYTVDSKYDGDEMELQPKETRQLFHFNGSKLVQNRLYPQGDESRSYLYTQYREVVERILCEGMDVPNLWSAPTRGLISEYDGIIVTPYDYIYYGEYIDCMEYACHGAGEDEFQDQVNYVTLKGTYGDACEVGSTEAVDIMTGEHLSEDYADAITYSLRRC